MNWRHVIYGDWTWLIRDPLDLLRIAFIGGTVAFAVMGRSTAVGLTAASVLLLVARIVNLPRWFDFSVIAAMTLIAWGTAFGFYGDYYIYDNIVHSLSPFFYSPVLYLALVRLGVLADPEHTRTAYNHAGVFISTLALGMAVGAGYEVVEWLSDTLTGTHFVKSVNDTGSDLLEDTLGSMAGATLVTVWSIRHWASRRQPLKTAPAVAPRIARRLAGAVRPFAASLRGRSEALPLGARGAIDVGAGVVILAWPSPAIRTVELVFGLAMVLRGAADIVDAARRRAGRERFAGAAGVVVELAIGTLLVVSPEISRMGFVYVVGASAVALAFVDVAAVSSREASERERWLSGAAAAAAFVFGIALLAKPAQGLDATLLVLGLYLLIVGVLRLLRSLAARLPQRASSSDVAVASAPRETPSPTDASVDAGPR